MEDRVWPHGPAATGRRDYLWRWAPALALLALVVLCDQVVIQRHLFSQRADAGGVNLAGRQRLLAVSLGREALALLTGVSSDGAQRLAETWRRWEEGHQTLVQGGGRLELAPPSPGAAALLARQEPGRQVMGQAVRDLLALAEADSPPARMRPDLDRLLAATEEHLPLMESLVSLLEEEARARVAGLRRLELLLAGANLVLLLGMALFIFVPLGRRLRQDMELLSASAQEMRDLSLQDGLTGVANRRHLDERLEREWRRAGRSGQPLSLVMLDIDHFKLFNDAHGHQAGDLTLVKVAGAVAWSARRAGDLAARYGGEEFVLLLPETPLDGAIALAGQLREQVRSLAIAHASSPVDRIVTVSLGVACYAPTLGSSGEPDDPSRLLEEADRSLYKAKQAGRDRVGPPRELK